MSNILIIKGKNSPKIFKIFKIIKKEKNQNKRQNQRLWHSLRSCRFKSKSKGKSINNAFAMLMLFQKQKLQSSHPFGMLCTYRLKWIGSL
jgi:hypothetical protein